MDTDCGQSVYRSSTFLPGFVRTALLAGRLSLVFNTLAQDPQVASKANEGVARGTERCGDDDTGNQKCFHVSVISSSAVMFCRKIEYQDLLIF